MARPSISTLIAAGLWLLASPLSAQAPATEAPETATEGLDPAEPETAPEGRDTETETPATETEASGEQAEPQALDAGSSEATQPVPGADEAPQAASPTPTEIVPGALRAGWSWDLAVEGGIGSPLEQADFAAFGRLRAGVFGLREPIIGAIGATIEAGHFGDVAIGLQGQLMHLWNGFGLSVGGAYSLDSYWMMHTALHYSVFGVEWQHRFVDDVAKNALFGKITIPIGLIAYLL